MESSSIILMIFVVLVIILVVYTCSAKKEGFDAAGMIFNVPPEWFRKGSYNVNDWYVTYYPDQLSKPGGCDMHYRGDPEELNYLSSAYRFWRM